jgi:hypothetical protein
MGNSGRYLLAAGFALLALALRVLLEPVLHLQVPFLTFFAAVVTSTWYGGLGPGALAIGLSVAVFLLAGRSLSISSICLP